MNNESNVGQPPTIPSGISPQRGRQSTQSEGLNSNFHKRFQDAQSIARSILEAIEGSPNIQELYGTANELPEDLRGAVENFISVLREVSSKLEKISSKYGVRNRGIRERIKYYLAMLRAGRCSRILQTCQDDVVLSSKVIYENLGDGANEALGSSLGAHLVRQTELPVQSSIAGEHSKSEKESPEIPVPSSGQKLIVASSEVPSTEGLGVPQSERVNSAVALEGSRETSGDPDDSREDPKKPIEPTGFSPSSTPIVSQSSEPGAIPDQRQVVATGLAQSSNVPEARSKSSRHQETLNMARKVFTSVEAYSGVIPIVGSYVGAAAKVGLTCVEMVQ
ncbi:hypothetical protein FRC04_001648, partial [Tulasnella sp. 424]